MAMQVAEVLGLPMEAVKPSIVDTDSIGYSSGAGGSGVTFKMGTACYEAAQDIKRQLIERAARLWQVEPQDVVYDKGVLHHKPDPELRITFATLARRLNGTGGPIVGRATVNPGGEIRGQSGARSALQPGGSRASCAIASTAACFMSSLIAVAPTSSAPRKMNGKHRTLLT